MLGRKKAGKHEGGKGAGAGGGGKHERCNPRQCKCTCGGCARFELTGGRNGAHCKNHANKCHLGC